MTAPDWWNLELAGMPGFEMAMKRVYAWSAGEIIDRPPVHFYANNAVVEQANQAYPSENIKDRWFDAEFRVDTFIRSIEGQRFRGETFPVFCPDLGPEVYSAFYGAELVYGEVSSWSKPLVHDWADMAALKLDTGGVYFKKLEELTRCALEKCQGRFLVGYTDLHPGVDCAAAWRDPQRFCMDLYDAPEQANRLINLAIADFKQVFDHFDAMLKSAGQLSVSWLGVPSFGRMHIPSCDFSSLISEEMYVEFGLPILRREVQTMTHNIFHVDGKGVARHLDAILSVPEVHALQWGQGVGDDRPIRQWVPLIKEMQARVPVIVDLASEELDGFMAVMKPEGLFPWIATKSEEEEIAILKRLERWAGNATYPLSTVLPVTPSTTSTGTGGRATASTVLSCGHG